MRDFCSIEQQVVGLTFAEGSFSTQIEKSSQHSFDYQDVVSLIQVVRHYFIN